MHNPESPKVITRARTNVPFSSARLLTFFQQPPPMPQTFFKKSLSLIVIRMMEPFNFLGYPFSQCFTTF